MSILIGIRKEHAHGSFHGAEGFEGFSIDTNSMVVIREDKKSDLVAYVNRMKAGMKTAREKLNRLEDDLERGFVSQKEYEKLYDKYNDMLYLSKFDKLMILEGDII